MSSLLRALFTGTSKHKKLSEEWATLQEPVMEGVTFYCKYLGSTLVDDPKGEAATAEAIKRIIHTAKQMARKPGRVSLHISLHGIRMEECGSQELLLQTSIYKISYCSADAHYDHVFAFIATNDNDTCECHAFLCPKRKMAQAVTISIAQAFNLAYECWKVSLESKNNGEIYGHEELPAEVTVGSAAVIARPSHSQPSSQTSSPIPIRSDFGSSDMSTSGYQSSSQALLIDLEDSSEQPSTTTGSSTASQPQSKISALSKPLDTPDDLSDISDGFSRLALRREVTPRALPGLGHLAGLDLAALRTSSPPIETGFWPSTSPPLASSPPDTWPPGEAWETYSRSPNTAFLQSCQSPPTSSSAFPFPSSPQSPSDFQQFTFSSSGYPSDPFFPNNHASETQGQTQKIIGEGVKGEVRGNPFLHSSTTTNPFIQREAASSAPLTSSTDSPTPPSSSPENPMVVMGSAGSGCGPSRSLWKGDLFNGGESKNVICS